MRLFTKLLGLALIAFATTQTANAATFDFIAYAQNAERGYNTFTKTEDSITLNARGEHTLDDGKTWNSAYAYLDDHWSGYGDAGLGVCKVLSSTQCNPGSDDNVTDDEKLILDFGQLVTISEITMADGKHGTAFTGDFRLNIDGTGWNTYSLDAQITQLFTGQVFEFWNDNGTDNLGDEFYISTMTVSAVPVPAAIWLFGSAMLGFTAIRRNNKKPA